MLAPDVLTSDAVNAALRSIPNRHYSRVAFVLRAETAKHIAPRLRHDFIESLTDRQALSELGLDERACLTGGEDGERCDYGKVVDQLNRLLELAGLSFR